MDKGRKDPEIHDGGELMLIGKTIGCVYHEEEPSCTSRFAPKEGP